MKYGEVNLGQIEAVINKLGGIDGLNRFLRGETIICDPNRGWREEGGSIFLTLISNGRTGEEWISHFKEHGIEVDDDAKFLLRSLYFEFTDGVTYNVMILRSAPSKTMMDILKKAESLNLILPSAEVACLIKNKLSRADYKAMGLKRIEVLHNAIEDSNKDPRYFSSAYWGEVSWLRACYKAPNAMWQEEGVGFAFIIPSMNEAYQPN